MNKQEIIDWKIAQLTQSESRPMPKEMAEQIADDASLAEELIFIENFWQQPAQQHQPTARLDSQFYQMLSNAQAVQRDMDTKEIQQSSKQTSVIERITSWLTPKPMMQLALLALVFVAGVNVNQNSPSGGGNTNLASLEQEVSSLNSMLALTMLQKSSAAERLTGVSYSQRTQLQDPQLLKTLVNMLAHDNSTAVRLAIISTLASSGTFTAVEEQLIVVAANEKNTLVQIQLCQLLLSHGSAEAQQELRQLLSTKTVDKEVSDILAQTLSISSI